MWLRCLPLALLLICGLATATPPQWTDAADETYATDERARIGVDHLEANGDYEAAYPWFLSAAEDGSPLASANLGWFYEEGLGVEQDGDRAVHWYGRAAETGAVRYSLHVAWIYLEGRLVGRDRAQAEQWFRFGIERDLPQAKLALGSVYYADILGGREGLGPEAEALLLDALEDGMVYATRFLGRMYLDGIGVERDVARGLSAVRLGAETRDPDMQSLLALLLARGDVIEADPVEANKWAALAAAAGDEQAAELQHTLEQTMLSDDEKAESLERARVWAEEQSVPAP